VSAASRIFDYHSAWDESLASLSDPGQGCRRLTDCRHRPCSFRDRGRTDELGLSKERIEDYARQGIAWVWPNLLLRSMIIIRVWFIVFLFRTPGKHSSD